MAIRVSPEYSKVDCLSRTVCEDSELPLSVAPIRSDSSRPMAASAYPTTDHRQTSVEFACPKAVICSRKAGLDEDGAVTIRVQTIEAASDPSVLVICNNVA